MPKHHKRLKTIAFIVALNVFGVYVGALFNFHMYHIFHKPLLSQDMICSNSKQKFIHTLPVKDSGDGSRLPNHDEMIVYNPSSDQMLPVLFSIRLSLQPKEQPLTSYTDYSLSLRAPPAI
jgi:hypothetical protein